MMNKKTLQLLGSLALLLTATVPAAQATPQPQPTKTEEPILVVRSGDQTWADATAKAFNQRSKPAGDRVIRAASASISDPNTWPVRGAKAGDGSYWTNLKLTVEGRLCTSPANCDKITDRLVVNTTVNPGKASSRINMNVSRPLNSGAFKSRVFYIQAICRGQMCGTLVTVKDQKVGMIQKTISGYGDRSGLPLTIGVAVSQATIRNTVQVMGKTADCIGRKGTDPRCFYK